MVFNPKTYSVLIVSSAEKFFDAMRPLLPESVYETVDCAASAAAAKRSLLERSYDLVIVNAPLRDEFGTRFAIDVSTEKNALCLLLIKADVHEETRQKVFEHGVFTLPKPISSATLTQALLWMLTVRERERKAEKKTISIEEKMQEIRTVNRAKWLLIEQLKMTEQDAHRYIEKQAMDRCAAKREIAMEIIKTYG